jgi:hypothetical protein
MAAPRDHSADRPLLYALFGNTPLVAAIESRNVALMTCLEEHGAREKP